MSKLSPADIDANREAIKDPNQTSVTLNTGFSRGGQNITDITIFKPKANAMRGLSVTSILQGDVDSLIRLIPRISSPTMTEADVSSLDLNDLVQLQAGVISFLDQSQTQDANSQTA